MKKIFILTTICYLLFTGIAFAAQENISNPPGNISNPPGNISNPGSFTLTNPFKVGDTLFELLETIVNRIILPIGGVLAVLAFIYSGFLYVTAQGKETQLAKAHKALLYTAIGTAVLLGSWVIANVIRATINQII